MKIETKTTHYVDAHELEMCIKHNFGKDYSIVAMEEAGNDSSLAFDVDGKWHAQYQESFSSWMNGDIGALMYGTHILMNKLAYVGIIPTGSYVVSISW